MGVYFFEQFCLLQITGGSSGIGRSIAIEAAARGANVTIIARNQSKLNAVKQEVLNACIKNSKDQTVSQSVNAVSCMYFFCLSICLGCTCFI